ILSLVSFLVLQREYHIPRTYSPARLFLLLSPFSTSLVSRRDWDADSLRCRW
ncbi:hypothetical protein CDV31_014373, partial [Fusarium ambrosium]